MKRYAAVIAAALAATCVGSARAADAVPGYVSASVNHRARPPFDRERDADRKPTEVLVFSGIKPGDRIAELAPERGYYTRMLSKIVGPKGMIYLVVPSLYTPDQERREEYEQLKKGVIKGVCC